MVFSFWISLSLFFLFSLFPQSSLSFFFSCLFVALFFKSSCGWGRMSRDILSPGRSRRQWLTTKGAEEAGLHKTIFLAVINMGRLGDRFFFLFFFSSHCPFLTLFARFFFLASRVIFFFLCLIKSRVDGWKNFAFFILLFL